MPVLAHWMGVTQAPNRLLPQDSQAYQGGTATVSMSWPFGLEKEYIALLDFIFYRGRYAPDENVHESGLGLTGLFAIPDMVFGLYGRFNGAIPFLHEINGVDAPQTIDISGEIGAYYEAIRDSERTLFLTLGIKAGGMVPVTDRETWSSYPWWALTFGVLTGIPDDE